MIRLKRCFRSVITALMLIGLLMAVLPARAEDVTLIGPNEAIYSLGDPLSEEILTADNVKAILDIADIVVEANRIRVRFFVQGITPAWADRITDSRRVGGSYLPMMELRLPSGDVVTPTTASRYSLTVLDDQLVVAGLSEFLTEEKPNFLILNFNQIPFDIAPLAEGASLPVFLHEGDNKQRSEIENPMSVSVDGVTMTLLNTAESPKISMFQPGITVERPNESLSGIGWFYMKAGDGRSVVLRRDIGYGFNIANDSRFFLRNCYYFNANSVPGPLDIGVEKIYLMRSVLEPEALRWQVSAPIGEITPLDIPLNLDEFGGRITGYQVFSSKPVDENHEHLYLRLFIDGPDELVAVNFSELADDLTLVTECGLVPTTGELACDVPVFTDLAYDIVLFVNSFEYQVDQTLTIRWDPIRYPVTPRARPETLTPISYDLSGLADANASYPELQAAITAVLNRSYALRDGAGWIVERTRTENAIPQPQRPELIHRSLIDQQPFTYTTDSYQRVNAVGNVMETVSLQREIPLGERGAHDTEKSGTPGRIINGTWSDASGQIVLPRGYWLEESNAINTGYTYPYLYGTDFLALSGTSIRYEKSEPCTVGEREATCLSFFQSLLLTPNPETADGTLRIVFAIDLNTGEVLRADTYCPLTEKDRDLSLCSRTELIVSERIDELPEDVQAIRAGFILE